jgi:hypothetical protein
MISDDLRRQADFFIDVADLAKTVGRPPSHKAAWRRRPPKLDPSTLVAGLPRC